MADAARPLSSALVTPSFRLDLAQCRMLVESVHRHVAPDVRHYLIVDRRDLPLFAPLRSARTTLVAVEDVVPWWVRRVPLVRRFWLSLKTPPLRNWMLQQIVKLSMGDVVDAEVLVFVDSDVFFVRPYEPRRAFRDGRVPLFREYGEPLRSAFNTRWHNVAAGLLGLPPQEAWLTSYVGNLITWRRDNLRALRAHIERTTGRGWVEALSRLPVLSEYVLYGLFCEAVLKEASGHFYESSIDSLCYWKDAPLDEAGLCALRAELRPEHVAVMISAKSRTDVATIARVFAG